MLAAKNLSDFFKAVRTIVSDWEGETNQYIDPWFRGQSDSEYPLLPSLYRYGDEVDEDDFRDEFNFKAFPFLNQMRAQDPWEAYALMQHYGLPTRLLDWSEAALVGLYFALSADNPKKSAAVWMLNPWVLNEKATRIPYILDSNDEKTASYLPPLFDTTRGLPQKAIAIQIPYNSPRISAQRGLFTIHGKERTPLEEQLQSPENCTRIEIPRRHVVALRRELYTAGVCESLLFPELGALCRDLKRHWILDREDVASDQGTAKVKPKSKPARRTLRR